MYKKVILAIALLLPIFAVAQKGESSIGAKLGYTTKSDALTAGIYYHYDISTNLRISPELGWILRHDHLDAFNMDVNLHFPLRLTATANQLYPIVGVNYTRWSHHGIDIPGYKNLSQHFDRWGANLGAGFQLAASDKWRVIFEAKYIITSDYSRFCPSIGLGCVF